MTRKYHPGFARHTGDIGDGVKCLRCGSMVDVYEPDERPEHLKTCLPCGCHPLYWGGPWVLCREHSDTDMGTPGV